MRWRIVILVLVLLLTILWASWRIPEARHAASLHAILNLPHTRLKPDYHQWPLVSDHFVVVANGQVLGEVFVDSSGAPTHWVLGFGGHFPVRTSPGNEPLWADSAAIYVHRLLGVDRTRLRLRAGPERIGNGPYWYTKVTMVSDDGRSFEVVFQRYWLFRVRLLS